MIAVRVMQMAVYEEISMVPVRNRFVAASGTVAMGLFVPAAGMLRSARSGIS
jgi:hypothetical protein